MSFKFDFLACILMFLSFHLTAQIKYEVPKEAWPEPYGNHRAVLEISKASEAVKLNLKWRRHDKNPDDRRFMLIHALSGDTISNIYRHEVNREWCRIAFGPVEKTGTYYFYYLPYKPVYDNYHSGPYLVREDEPDKLWMEKNGLPDSFNDSGTISECMVKSIQARTAFHSFYPMEVPATKAEVSDYLNEQNDRYLVFPEDRIRPIKMLDMLPYRWTEDKPSEKFDGTALKKEYYALQLGVYASKEPLENLHVSFTDLKGKHRIKIPSSSITCFNTHGVDIEGKPFTKRVSVAQGRVQPLWVGIDIPADIKPGEYEGIFTVSADNQGDKEIAVAIEIKDELLADRGDGETWRHSRLRWLNSSIGIDNEPVRPFTNITVEDRTISVLGRKVHLNDYGLPSSIKAWGKEIIAAPIRFNLESGNRVLQFTPVSFKYTDKKNGLVSWEAISENESLQLICNGEIEFDGRMSYTYRVKAKSEIHLQDIRLEIPYKKDMATYMIGMSRMGGFTPEFHKSRWRKEEDSFWLGNTKGGLHCELRGGEYHGPLLNLYQPNHPRSWYNGVNGGFRIDTHQDIVTASVYSGYRPMRQGQGVKYEFAFIITPVKPYNSRDQFSYRYEHNPHPREKVVLHGGNMMNVHHANEYNPYINYPFIANDKLKGLVDKWHAKDWKVKIYYTVRELSNYLTEIWALRSLGFEVLADGPGGGYQWLQEHLVDNYRYQWYTHIGDGTVDAAILNSGESRWYNYYLEGLAWLLKEIDIDGLYLDDFSYDRRVLKRMRKIMEDIKPGQCHIDVHSNNAFTRGPANQYLEIYPYIDRTWYGEGFNFDLMPPDFWLSEVSGVPFGVVNELLLHRSVNKGRRGMVYGMVPRGDWGMWKFWKEFGIESAKMMGYWEQSCPVKTDHEKVKATVYSKEGKALIVLGNWVSEPLEINLEIDWENLGLDQQMATYAMPQIENYQAAQTINSLQSIEIDPKGVKFIVISRRE